MATLTETTPITEMTSAVSEATPVVAVSPRNVAVDAYRGLVMLLMMAEVLELSRVSAAYPTSLFWKILAYNQTHVEWFGCSLHDTIQPGFSFLVGVALPYSIASRMAKGVRFADLFWHALWRSFALAALGVFLRSMDHSMTYFTFEDTLSQIGFAYPFLFLLGYASSKAPSLKWVWTSLGCILFAYWLAWALYPAAPAHFNWQSVGVSPAWNTAQLHRIRRALEQKLQFRKPLRPVVPEPVPARTSLCVQRRRLPLAEFHSHPGDHDPWPDRRALAA